VIPIHGTADHNIPYAGGRGDGVAHIHGPPVLVQQWQHVDDCAAPTVSTSGPVTISMAGCPNGRAVELITLAEAGHQWPGGSAKPLVERTLQLDPPARELSATPTFWQFFQDHPRR